MRQERLRNRGTRVSAGIVLHVDVTVLVIGHPGDAYEQAIGRHDEIRAAARLDVIARAVEYFYLAALVRVGLLRVQLDRSADRVLARQSALRPA